MYLMPLFVNCPFNSQCMRYCLVLLSRRDVSVSQNMLPSDLLYMTILRVEQDPLEAVGSRGSLRDQRGTIGDKILDRCLEGPKETWI